MRAVIQRVARSGVSVAGALVAEIENGFNVLLGVSSEDTPADAKYIADKIAGLRVFEDKDGKLNCDIKYAQGSVLLISQFTLYGDTRNGLRPSFIQAAEFEEGRALYEQVAQHIKGHGIDVETGRYGADMRVEIINDGPVTILIDSRKLF